MIIFVFLVACFIASKTQFHCLQKQIQVYLVPETVLVHQSVPQTVAGIKYPSIFNENIQNISNTLFYIIFDGIHVKNIDNMI